MQDRDKRDETTERDALSDRISDATNPETLAEVEAEEVDGDSGSAEDVPSPDANPIAEPDHQDDAGPM